MSVSYDGLGKQALSALWGVLLGFVLVGVSLFFGLSWWQYGLLLCGLSAGLSLWRGTFVFGKEVKTWIVIMLFLSTLKVLSWFGFLGYVLGIVFVIVWFMYSRWGVYVQQKQNVERVIWGRPLKDFREEGVRPPKLKFKL